MEYDKTAADRPPLGDPDAPRARTDRTVTSERFDGRVMPWVFWPATVVILAFVILTMVFPEGMESAIGTVQSVIISNFSWWYVLLSFGLVVFCLYVGFSRKGSIILGRPDTKPEFSTVAWLSLLFAAGMGIVWCSSA